LGGDSCNLLQGATSVFACREYGKTLKSQDSKIRLKFEESIFYMKVRYISAASACSA
jgi:hypothetical protein